MKTLRAVPGSALVFLTISTWQPDVMDDGRFLVPSAPSLGISAPAYTHSTQLVTSANLTQPPAHIRISKACLITMSGQDKSYFNQATDAAKGVTNSASETLTGAKDAVFGKVWAMTLRYSMLCLNTCWFVSILRGPRAML